MTLLQKIQKRVQKIGKQSAGIVFPRSYIFIIERWFDINKSVEIETHIDEDTKEEYILIRRSRQNDSK